MSEVPERIPFWAEVYRGTRKYQFEKDISFLLFHSVSVQEWQPDDEKKLICDFSFVQDLAYAMMAQDEAELDIYKTVHRHVVSQCGDPDLIINLRCPTSTLLSRIAARGRDPERTITGDFLDYLVERIDNLLITPGCQIPVVTIDSGEFDFATAPDRVIARVKSFLQEIAT